MEKTVSPSRTTSNWDFAPFTASASMPALRSSAARLAARSSYPFQTGQYRISTGTFSSLYSQGVPVAERRTVDLSSYPDLVVIYLGQRVNRPKGLWTTQRMGPAISKAVGAKPDGLLLHEMVIWSLLPPHLGMRQYWRDFDSLERWARSLPHQEWWRNFLRDSGGTGFWHETYFMRGGMEAIYDDLPKLIGLASFAPVEPARGRMFGARSRAGREGAAATEPALSEGDLYRK